MFSVRVGISTSWLALLNYSNLELSKGVVNKKRDTDGSRQNKYQGPRRWLEIVLARLQCDSFASGKERRDNIVHSPPEYSATCAKGSLS